MFASLQDVAASFLYMIYGAGDDDGEERQTDQEREREREREKGEIKAMATCFVTVHCRSRS